MRLLYFSDAHIRASTPASRIDNYPDAIWKKFQKITELISEYDIDAVLNGGDLFDTADPATSIVNKYLELFKSWEIPIYSIVGSHDKFGYNDETLPRTALGTLIAAGVVEIVNETKVIGRNCQIAGVSHSYSLDEDPKDYFRKKYTNEYMIQMCHGMIVNGPWGFGKATQVQNINTEADLVLCGHYHPGFKPVQVGNSTIMNIGSLGRTEKTTRVYEPSVLFIDTTAEQIWRIIPIGAELDVFNTKEELTMPNSAQDMVAFINALKEQVDSFECGNLTELIMTVGKELGLSQKVIDKAMDYIDD